MTIQDRLRAPLKLTPEHLQCWDDLALQRLEAADTIDALVEALEWYAKQVAGCRKVTSEGEASRNSLDKDGGQRARAALARVNGDAP